MKTNKNIIIFLIISFGISYHTSLLAKVMPFAYCPEEYDTLLQEDWPQMKETFDMFLSFKSVDEVINYPERYKASFTLVRMTRINWNGPVKKEVSSYLIYMLDELLKGNSYFKPDLITFPQSKPAHHPMYLPKHVIWALFLIDNETALPIVKNIWTTSSSLPDNSYLVNIREFTLWLFENSNNKTTDKFFLDNYSVFQNSLSNNEKKVFPQIKLKCEISQIDDQKKAWEYIWNQSELNNTGIMNDQTQQIWYKYNLIMQKVYGNPDLKTIIRICKNSDSPVKKYIFLYSACFNTNSQLTDNSGYEVEESIINYINQATEEMKSKNTQLQVLNTEKDFMRSSYDSMKTNLSKKGK